MIPMSEEGFLAMANEIVDEINDDNTAALLTRLGLPTPDVVRFLARVTTSLAPGLNPTHDEKTLKTIGDIFTIGILIGHKTAEWQAQAHGTD